MKFSRVTFLAFSLSALVFGVGSPARAATPLPSSLVQRADGVLRGKTTAALLEMHIHTKSQDRTYTLSYWGDDRGGTSRALIKILGPARFRGHGTLKVGGRLSLYDPSTDGITVLSGSMLGDGWMGSHFTNDDLVKETDLARDYHSRELKTWAANVDGKPVTFHRIQLEPTPQAPVAWNHIVFELFTRDDVVIPTREDFYRRATDAAPDRVLSFEDLKQMGGRLVPTRLTMRPANAPGEYTELIYKEVRFDADVPASKFSDQALRR